MLIKRVTAYSSSGGNHTSLHFGLPQPKI